MNLTALIFLISVSCFVHGQYEEEEVNERAQRLAKMMQPDGVERVVTLTSKNFKSLLKKFDIVVVLYHAQSNATALAQEKRPLEVVAKLFDKKRVVCTTCDVLKNAELARQAGVQYAGTIKIFNHRKLSTYFGQRSPDVIVSYISKMFDPPVTEILSKTAKKAFDHLSMPKVIAYLQKDSREYAELQKVGRTFQPMIQFHAVFDAKIAKSLQMKKVNSLLFMKPHEKSVKIPSKISWQEKPLTDFINKNRRQIIRKMRLENLHDIWSPDSKGYMVAVFANVESPDGNRFFSLVKTLARNFANNEKLNFVWIDPDPFPAMKEYWQSTFNIDPTKPSMGAVDLAGQSSTWLSPPINRPLQIDDITKWTRDLLSGKLTLKPMDAASKAKDQDTGSQEEKKDEL